MNAPDRIHVYGLVPPDAVEAVGAALDGVAAVEPQTAVRCVLAGPCGVIASASSLDKIPRRRRTMLAHTRVLEAAMGHATVLPMRFGVLAESTPALALALEGRAAELDGLFARMAGACEFGLRISWPREHALAALVAESPDIRSRRDRLAQLGAAGHYERIAFGQHVAEQLDRRRKRAQDQTLALLREQARDHVLLAPEEDVETLRAAFLIDAEGEAAFLDAATAAARAFDFAPGAEPQIRFIGPAPIYNFVSLSIDVPELEKV